MKYQAITIDTQVVYKNNRQLDRGTVAQLEQYSEGPIKFILSEIVLRELIKMLEEKAKSPRDALTKTIREGEANGQLNVDQKTQLQSVLDSMEGPTEHAKSQLKDFIAKTNAHLIAAEVVTMKPLLDAYFAGNPPFSGKGKKHEFPDAISILALEHWAKSENTKILAVSGDGDWKSFAEKSEWIDCVDDLATAMSSLLEGVEAVEKEARNVVQQLTENNPVELWADFERFLERATENENPYIEFSSSMPADYDYATLTLKHVGFGALPVDEIDISIVRVSADGFVMRVPVELTVAVEAEINFSIHDSIDGDDVHMGSTSVEREVEIEAYALVHCSRHIGDNEEGEKHISYEIDNAELVDFPTSVDIDYVDYSMADDYEEFDPDEWVTEPDEPQQEVEVGVQPENATE